jgi:peptidoglycan/xylan/chitin deacetylase (PgdA/CDA1 family)
VVPVKVPWHFLRRRRVVLPSGGVLVVALVAGALFWFQPRFLLKVLSDRNPDVLFYVETDRPVLALTIDDAPSDSLTSAILDILERHDVRATFFLIGDRLAGREDVIARMKAHGHELGNHMARDEASILLTDEEFAAQLLAVEEKIGPLEGTKWCRPGSGWFSPGMVKIAHDRGYRCCLGSIYPFDNKLRHKGLILDTVLDRIFPGSILILHEGGPEREYILPLLEDLLPAVKARGYEFLTLSELEALETP